MNTSWKQLSRPLRVAIAAPWLLLVAAATLAATPGGQQLLLDYANRPTGPVSLSSSNWTGTLDPARLPGSVPLLADLGSGSGSPIDLNVQGAVLQDGILIAYQGALFYPNNYTLTDLSSTLYYPNGVPLADPAGILYSSSGGKLVDSQGSLYAGGILVADFNGNLYSYGNISNEGVIVCDNSNNSYANSYTVNGGTVIDASQNGYFNDLSVADSLNANSCTINGGTVIDASQNGYFNDLNINSELNMQGAPILLSGSDQFYADGTSLYYQDNAGTLHTLLMTP